MSLIKQNRWWRVLVMLLLTPVIFFVLSISIDFLLEIGRFGGTFLRKVISPYC